MKNRLQKTLSLCLTMLLLMSALPFPAAVAEASEPIPQEETAPDERQAEAPSAEAAPEDNQQAEEAIEQPTEEPAAEQPEQPTEEPTEEPIEQPTAEPAAEATPEASQATAEPTADPIAAFFGIASIEGYEDFYRALYAYSLGRAGGMPLTIQLTGSETATFDGAKHQKAYTEGTITTTVAMPDYYTVTFEATAVGRIPGSYSPQLSGISVWDSKNNVNMTNFFDPKVTGGGLEITASGSLLMISADDVEIEFNGFYQELVGTTGQAYINWMPMSDELRLTLRATVAGHPYLPNTYAMSMESYAVEVIEDGTDITEYFEYKFASTGDAVITPPVEKIGLQFDFGEIEREFTGYHLDETITSEIAMIAGNSLPDELSVSASGNPVLIYTRSTGQTENVVCSYRWYVTDFSVTVIEGGIDITEYFQADWDTVGHLLITLPTEPIPLVIRPEPAVIQYTGSYILYYGGNGSVYLNGDLVEEESRKFIVYFNLRRDTINRAPGVYEITQDDWEDPQLLGVLGEDYHYFVLPEGVFDITILPTTLTILEP